MFSWRDKKNVMLILIYLELCGLENFPVITICSLPKMIDIALRLSINILYNHLSFSGTIDQYSKTVICIKDRIQIFVGTVDMMIKSW